MYRASIETLDFIEFSKIAMHHNCTIY